MTDDIETLPSTKEDDAPDARNDPVKESVPEPEPKD